MTPGVGVLSAELIELLFLSKRFLQLTVAAVAAFSEGENVTRLRRMSK